jgi:hypothetical protein
VGSAHPTVLKDLSGRSQPITIYSFFSGDGSNNLNKPEREIVQLYGPIPRARYEILDDRNNSDPTHQDFYRLDRLDWFPRNDRDDVLNRNGFRLHPGVVSQGCITLPKTNTEDWKLIQKMMNGTDKEEVLDSRGWEWLKNIPRTKYGEINVVT